MKLDTSQENAAQYISGHSIIIAGAGSGKTATLINKVNYIIENGYANESEILVISFTNKTVDSFKNKSRYSVDVYTFHKIALIISQSISNIEVIEDGTLKDYIKMFLYNMPIELKIRIHKIFRTNFYNRYNERTFSNLVESNKFYGAVSTIFSMIKIIKANNINVGSLNSDKFSNNEAILLYITSKINEEYKNNLKENDLIDFDSLIVNATKILSDKKIQLHYKYIIVDEFQDISQIRMDFLKSLVYNTNSILCVVGDDWQSIYGFSGSNIDLFYSFNKQFDNVKTFYLSNSYRCPQKIINVSRDFICKNPKQIRKNIVAVNRYNGKIKKVYYANKKKSLYKLLLSLLKLRKEILVLSRNNYDINEYLSQNLKYHNEKFIINNKILENVQFMTIHKAKGLEADIVILLNLTNKKDGLPSKKTINIMDKILPKTEKIKFAEERRLLYVALTRTKTDVYLLVDLLNPSGFIKEV